MAELEAVELRMLKFTVGVTRLDRIRNEHVKSMAKVKSHTLSILSTVFLLHLLAVGIYLAFLSPSV